MRRTVALTVALVSGCAEKTPPERLQQIPWQGSGADSVADRGIGVLFPAGPALADSSHPTDSLFFRAVPAPSARLVGAFLREPLATAGWMYAILGPRGTVPNLLEYGYEEAGVPIDSVAGQWVRVIFGFDSAGMAQHGWAQVQPGRDSLLLWAEHLPAQPLFFFDREAAAIYALPGQGERPFPIQTGPDRDYIMYGDERQGPWLKVRIVSPSDYCNDPSQPATWTGWIRYLRDDGRPRVWYYTRGC
jgi:hypothetical protein